MTHTRYRDRASEAPEHIPRWLRIQWPDQCIKAPAIARRGGGKKGNRSSSKPVLITLDGGAPLGIEGSAKRAAAYIGCPVRATYRAISRGEAIGGYLLRYATPEEQTAYPRLDAGEAAA